MGFDKEVAKKVMDHIDRDELAQLGCDLTSIPSPTGPCRNCSATAM